MSEEIKELRKVSVKEMLNGFYNVHLKEVMSAWIDIDIYSRMVEEDPNQVVGEQVGPTLKEGQMPTKIQIRAKDMLKNTEKKFMSQSNILVSIEKRLEELTKLKEDKEIWRDHGIKELK